MMTKNEIFKTFAKLQENRDKIEELTQLSDEEFESTFESSMSNENETTNNVTTNNVETNDEDNEEHEDMNPTQGLRFDDLKSAFRKFSGDNKTNISTWVTHFEEQCKIFKMSSIRKFIFAKRMMEGAAKLFIEYESSAVDWKSLKAELIQVKF